jgi:asparagine synthase (glutamine-hydrolysing)
MGKALERRGPDHQGILSEPGWGLVSRRLAIVGLKAGNQPLWNEDQQLVAICNGEFFDYPEVSQKLRGLGHQFSSDSDCEILLHLWEEYGLDFVEHLRGQFALALIDRQARRLILVRDRMGICPLYYAVRQGWLFFASEIKALLATEMVEAEMDPLGLDHVFTFFAMSTRRTMFAGVSSLLPGHFLHAHGQAWSEQRYWDLDFPDQGQEVSHPEAASQLDQILRKAVALRLRAEVPVVSYLSGGVDSSLIATLASQYLGRPIPTYSIRIPHPKLDESERALLTARKIGSQTKFIECGNPEIAATYPALIRAAECPVIDTSSAAIYRLAAAVHADGYRVTLTGEGADEALAGYPWFKIHKALSNLEKLGLASFCRRLLLTRAHPDSPNWPHFARRYEQMGGFHATSDLYAACSLSGSRVYSQGFLEQLQGRTACDDLVLNLERMKLWHPLNRSLYLGYKVMLVGLLMTHKGDRPAMANSVESRFPFLDEEVVAFCASLPPQLKLKGLFRDKHLLREVARKYLPAGIAERPKHIFRAPYAGSFLHPQPAYVGQLLSPESLHRTGYFCPKKVAQCQAAVQGANPITRARHEFSFVAVLVTQIWHHLFLGGQLCDL